MTSPSSHDVQLPEGTPVAITVVRREPDPTFLSQQNCHLRGLPPAKFLRALRESGLPVTSLGNLRVVDAASFDAWLRGRASARAVPTLKVVSTEDQELEGAGLRKRTKAG